MPNGLNWYRGGEVIAKFPTNADPLLAGSQIRNLLENVIGKHIYPAYDTLECSGDADFGKSYPLLLPDCTYRAGDGGCTWTTRVMIDKTEHKPLGTPGFILGKYSSFRGMKFVGRCHDPNEDGGLIGWNAAMDATVSFHDCEFDAAEACDWCFYNWSPGKKTVFVDGGTGKFCRFGFAMMDSGSGNQFIELRDFRTMLDANGSKTYGESSNNNPENGAVLTTVAIRGGKATLRNVHAEAIGLKAPYDKTGKFGCPRIAALVTDQYYSNGQPCAVAVDGCSSDITAATASVWNDIDLRRSSLKLIRHEGSGLDGLFRQWGK